ncbi:MAG: serine hydrolase domain-containing protein [Spirochaetota bacterium]
MIDRPSARMALRVRTAFHAGLALALLATLGACATTPQPPDLSTRGDYGPLIDYVTEAIPRAMEEHDVTGLSVALVDGDGVVWIRGFGEADTEAGVPADERTVYRIGSITKLFTATAMMQLAEQGLVDIDAPVTDYVPEFRVRSRFADAGPIRVRHLMTHHSGLPGDKIKAMFGDPPEHYREIVPYLATQHVSTPPDFVFAYSNLAVGLAGVVIERASGLSYEEYVTRNILDRLGMHGTSVSLDERTASAYAKAYSSGTEQTELDLGNAPAGGIYSSVADMTRFVRFAIEGGEVDGSRVLEAQTLAQMMSAQNEAVTRDLGRPMGLGWAIERAGLGHVGRVAWHNGSTMYHQSTMVVLPEHGLGVVLLSNSDTGSRVIEPMADTILTMALEVREGIAPPEEEATCAGRTLSPELAATIAGRYATPLGVIDVQQRGRRLVTRLPGTPRLNLVPCGDGWLAPQFRLLGLLPLPVADLAGLRFAGVEIEGKRYLAAKSGRYGQLIGAELEVVPIPPTWRAAEGTYRVVNPDPGWGFRRVDAEIVDGVAIARVSLFNGDELQLVLEPVNEREAVVQGIGRNTGDTVTLRFEGERPVIEATGYVFERE